MRTLYWLCAALYLLWPAAAQAAPRITVLGYGYGKPDDLAWGPHSSIYFVDFANSALNLLQPDGSKRVVWSGLRLPEGIVVESDGSLLVVEQGTNQLLRIDRTGHSARLIASIPNHTRLTGIDGIVRDPIDNSIIVPDSPSGRIFRLTASGHLVLLAHGFGRPVGAVVDPDGSIVVVDEHLNGAFRIDPRGTWYRVGGYLSVPDDILGDGHGGYYVTCLGDGTIRHIDRRGGTTLTASGVPNPQGLLRRADGVLIVAEEDANSIVAIQP